MRFLFALIGLWMAVEYLYEVCFGHVDRFATFKQSPKDVFFLFERKQAIFVRGHLWRALSLVSFPGKPGVAGPQPERMQRSLKTRPVTRLALMAMDAPCELLASVMDGYSWIHWSMVTLMVIIFHWYSLFDCYYPLLPRSNSAFATHSFTQSTFAIATLFKGGKLEQEPSDEIRTEAFPVPTPEASNLTTIVFSDGWWFMVGFIVASWMLHWYLTMVNDGYLFNY